MNESNIFKQFKHSDFTVAARDIKYQGFFRVDQYQLKHKLFNGEWGQLIAREIFERGDAVVLIPYDPLNNTLILIEQFRPGAIRTEECPWMLEFIAGMFAENESPVDVAIREAAEEANLVVDKTQVQHVMNYLASPGGTSEKLYMYVALLDLSHFVDGTVSGLADEHEDIKSHLMSLEDALEHLNNGRVSNASTIIGLQWLALNSGKLA
ncbi:NUDIX domain-containing protein [Thalassotalea sp. ND16A]|uniref:NUDIX domain-containing protein n=1 Tax=Thalassotalea sp. ND16A TaxID=1535422 RepID=UPI00051A0430|nr:NUDIX domain-containing protein [Thalassotalea sp. ND16A]KGJ89307.1 ADP-ribose diphosphatase [Thalassotalea sp. ND16A]